MYANENNDKLVRVGGIDVNVTDPSDPKAQPGGPKSQWVVGRVDQWPSATNELLDKASVLFSYVKNIAVYKCPANKKQFNAHDTVRSMSMNCWMNPI